MLNEIFSMLTGSEVLHRVALVNRHFREVSQKLGRMNDNRVIRINVDNCKIKETLSCPGVWSFFSASRSERFTKKCTETMECMKADNVLANIDALHTIVRFTSRIGFVLTPSNR